MKRERWILCTLVLCALVVFFSSCLKSNNTPPDVTLYGTTVYVSNDTTLKHGTIFSVFLTARKAGTEQLLTSGKISVKVNDQPDSVIQNMNLYTTFFNQFYSYKAGDSGTVTRYTFSFGQLNGLTGDTSITITSN